MLRVLFLSFRIIFGLKRWDLGADMSVHNKGHIGALAFFCGNNRGGQKGCIAWLLVDGIDTRVA